MALWVSSGSSLFSASESGGIGNYQDEFMPGAEVTWKFLVTK